MLENYKCFRLQSLFFQLFSLSEDYIECASDLLVKLRQIKQMGGRSGEIAEIIIHSIDDETEVGQLSQNYFDLSNTDDRLTFTYTNRIPYSEWEQDENPSLPYEMSPRGELKVGRAIRYMLNLLNKSVTDKDLEDFVNLFKSQLTNAKLEFRLVKGENISKYYKVENYFSDRHGTLGNSCMKEEGKKTFKIYSENPDNVGLLILIDDKNKIHGRAIVWKLDESPCESVYLMDRVYTNKDSDVFKFKRFADENNWMYKRFNTSYIYQSVEFVYKGSNVNGVLKVELNGDFSQYPYVDTMSFLSKDKKQLSNVPSKRCYKLKSLYGSKERCDECLGRITLDDYGTLCSECSTGHQRLKELGVETKWNKKR
jgi:hypothetical protein